MSVVEEFKNGEKIFPIFLKKKVLPVEKLKELREMMKELVQENDQLISDEKLMLDKIRAKDNEFISILQDHLVSYKMAGIENIILISDMLPAWSQENESTDADIDDATHRLAEWYETMATYVSMQRDGVNQIVSDYFSHVDKIAGEGEPDPQLAEVPDLPAESSKDSETSWGNISSYIMLIVFFAINLVIFYMPAEVSQCLDAGVYKCFIQYMMKFSIFVHDHYLKFHNITLEYPSMASNISTDVVQHSSRTEL